MEAPSLRLVLLLWRRSGSFMTVQNMCWAAQLTFCSADFSVWSWWPVLLHFGTSNRLGQVDSGSNDFGRHCSQSKKALATCTRVRT